MKADVRQQLIDDEFITSPDYFEGALHFMDENEMVDFFRHAPITWKYIKKQMKKEPNDA